VVLFVLFGAFLQKTGGGDFFVELAYALTGRMRGGPAKTAVVASAFMGSISGSPTANVVTTGSFTIPMMKKIGYPPHAAGGVEVAASVGGVLLPPVMGSAAFLIVGLTGIPYTDIIRASIIPSILYFISVFASVHFMACRLDLVGIRQEGDYWENLFKIVWRGIHYLVPLAFLVVILLIGYSPTYSAFGAIICLLIVSSLRKSSRMSIRDFLEALELGARNSLTVSAACACVGIIVGVVITTGVGLKFSSIIVSASGGNLIFAVILVILASLLLGIELPISASYLVVAILAAPALKQLGIPLLVAHLVVLWVSIDAAVTPPVCITSYIAAGIAQADPFKTAIYAWKTAKGLYLIPFLMIFTPITLNGAVSDIVMATISGILGLVSFTAAWEGWFLVRTRQLERVLLVVVTAFSLHGGLLTDLVGIILFIAIFLVQFFRRKPSVTNTA
jgi:TRAP transporter 4TM/12TM fusion protein